MRLPYTARRAAAVARTLLDLERRSPGPLRPGMLRRGFLSNRAWLYPLDAYPLSTFLTDVEIESRLPELNEPAAADILGDKRAFHAMARSGALPGRTATLVAIADNGVVTVPDGAAGWPDAAEDLVAKPAGGSGGRGVRLVRSPAELPRDGVFVVERPVAPHPYGARIFPHALNTVRVLVGRDGGGRLVLLGAAHRFGTARSAPTDNFKAGGIVAGVDLSTGELSAAVVLGPGPRRTTLGRHPETGAAIAGVTIPFWSEVRAVALRCTEALDGLNYVGWDIALAPDGPVVVEGNAGLANPNIVQTHRPMLLDEASRRFFAERGVISPRRLRAAERAANRVTTVLRGAHP